MSLVRALVISAGLAIAACGGGGDSEPAPAAQAGISGSVQKGPFALGSEVEAFRVNADGSTGGRLASALVSNDLGAFELDVEAGHRLLLTATGYYFSELDGSLSLQPLELRALARTGPDSADYVVNINVLTHLSSARALHLFAEEGRSFDAALNEAADEVLAALASIAPPPSAQNMESLTSLGLFGDSPADAGADYLLLLSSVLAAQAADMVVPQNTDAATAVEALLTALADDLLDGEINDTVLLDALREQHRKLDPDAIADTLATMLAQSGSELYPPVLDRILDTDLDGEPNATDTDDDADGVDDAEDAFPRDGTEWLDTDSDGVGNNADDDDDDDGVADQLDAFPLDETEAFDTDGDGTGNNADMDDDNDQVADADDFYPLDAACFAEAQGNGSCDIDAAMPASFNWTQVLQLGDVIHLLSPADERIYRWSVREERYFAWLDVGEGASVMTYAPVHQRIYVAFDSGDIRALQLGSYAESAFATATAGVTGLAAAGDFLVADTAADNMRHVYRYNGSQADSLRNNSLGTDLTWVPQQRRLFGLQPTGRRVQYQELNEITGKLGYSNVYNPTDDFSVQSPLRVSADGSRLRLGSGSAFAAETLLWLGSLQHTATDLQILDDGATATIRGANGDTYFTLYAASGDIQNVAGVAGAPRHLLVTEDRFVVITEVDDAPVFTLMTGDEDLDNDGIAYINDAFPTDPAASQDTDGDGYPDAWNDGKSAADSTTALALDSYPDNSLCYLPGHGEGGVCDTNARIPAFVPERIVRAANGTVYLADYDYNRIYRWTLTDGYVDVLHAGLPEYGRMVFIEYMPATQWLFVAYETGITTRIDTAADSSGGAREQFFAKTPLGGPRLAAAGNFMAIQDSSGAWVSHFIFGTDGNLRDYEDWNYPLLNSAWNAALNRLYFFRDGTSPNDLHYEVIDQETGEITAEGETPYHGSYPMIGPIRISGDGSRVLLGAGDIYDAITLQWNGALPARFADGLWLADDHIATLSETDGGSVFVRRSDSGKPLEVKEYGGTPLRLFAEGDNFLLVTQGSSPILTLHETSNDSDGDGVLNPDDAFAHDPAASVDTDLDGYPDAWNAGSTAADSTTGLTLDSYPADSACYLPEHGDGSVCDVTSTMPDFIPQRVEIGADGVVYLFSPENRRIYRWDSESEVHLNPLHIGKTGLQSTIVPTQMIYHRAHERIYLGYESGEITFIDLQERPEEVYFAALSVAVGSLGDAGDFLLAQDRSGGWATHHTFAADGDLQGSADVNYYSPVYVWNETDNRLYYTSSDYLRYEEIDPVSGEIARNRFIRLSSYTGLDPALSLSADGSKMLVSNGDIVNLDPPGVSGALPGEFRDGAWLSNDNTVVINWSGTDTELVRRSVDGKVLELLEYEGSPLRLLPVPGAGERFVVVTELGRPQLSVYVPDDDSDGDGVDNLADDFPLDVAASVDSDGDGYPDAWNAGRTAADSTTGLALDAYPADSACYLPAHGDGTTCDVTATMPDYVPLVTELAGDVVYTFSPENFRVYRWNAATQSHMNPLVVGDEAILVSTAPTQMALHRGHNRLYFGYASGLLTYIDLSAPEDGEQVFATHSAPPRVLAEAGYFLWVSSGATATYSLAGDLVGSTNYGVPASWPLWSAAQERVYFLNLSYSPRDVYYQSVDQTNGVPGSQPNSPYHGDYSFAGPLRLADDGSRLLLGSGDIYNVADLTWVGRVPGPIADGVLAADGQTLTLTDVGETAKLTRRDAGGRELETVDYSGNGIRLLSYGSQYVVVTDAGRPAYALYVPNDDTDGDGVTNTADDFPLDPAAAVDSDNDGYPDAWNGGATEADSTTGLALDAYPDDSACYLSEHGDGSICDVTSTMPNYDAMVVAQADGIVYTFSPINNRVFRWDAATQAHMNPLVIGSDSVLYRDAPTMMVLHEQHDRLYFAYTDGRLTYIELAGDSREQYLASHPTQPRGIQQAGDYLWVAAGNAGNSGRYQFTYSRSGEVASSNTSGVYSATSAWNPVLNRVYMFRDSSSPNDILYQPVDPVTGALTSPTDSPYHTSTPFRAPIRLSADGTRVLLGRGDIYDAATLNWQASIPDNFVDAQWTGNGGTVVVLEGSTNTIVHRRDSNGHLVEMAEFPGMPRSIVPYGDNFVVVSHSGRPVYAIYEPNDDVDGDGVSNVEDGFPDDAAASVDVDRDGYPDAWNDGSTAADSTTGLVLDAYPLDSACYEAAHGNGSVCDVTSTLPDYSPAVTVMDDAGIVYLLNPETSRIYRWDSVTGAHLNPVVLGASSLEDYQQPTAMSYHSSHYRLYLGYESGVVSYVDLAEAQFAERVFATLPTRAMAMQAAGSLLWVSTAQSVGFGITSRSYDINGNLKGTESNGYSTLHTAWSDEYDYVYTLRAAVSPTDLQYQHVWGDGRLDRTRDSPYHGQYTMTGPIRVSRGGAKLMLGSGDVYSASTLERQESLGVAFADMVWMPGSKVVTARASLADTVLERRNTNYVVTSSETVSGAPLRVFDNGAELVLVVQGDTQPEFHLFRH